MIRFIFKQIKNFCPYLLAGADRKGQFLSLSFSWSGQKRTVTFLIMVVLLGGLLRFYRLGEIPLSLDWDEVSLGYNAWALLETGRDEFGNRWPLSIRSFGDYKPPLYTYLLIPSIKIFGRTELAVRFPSALAGTATVAVTYFLVMILLRSDLGVRQGRTFSNYIAMLSAFFLAVSPWHLQFSRIGFEANVGLMFFVTGMWLLIRALRQRLPWSMFLAVISMSLGMMTYHSLRVVTPLVVLATLFIYRKDAWSLIRPGLGNPRPGLYQPAMILSTVLTILTVSTIFYTVFFQNVGQSRFKETSFLTIDDLLTVSRRRIEKSGGNLLDRAVNHRFLVYGRQYLKGYLDHYNLRFWLLDGDRNDRHRTPGVGLLYWWEFPLLATGFIGLISRIWHIRQIRALLAWFSLAAAAAALTGGTPSAVRSLAFLPTFQIVEAFGLIWLIRQISRIRRIGKILLLTPYSLLVIFEISYYFHQYYTQAAVETAAAWQYGYKQLVNGAMSEKDNYEKVIVTTAYDQPYIYFLWYGNYDPKFWINDGEFNKRFDKFEFRKIEWSDLSGQEKTLVISSPDETKGKPVKWQIDFPDGKTAFNAIEL